MISGIMVSLYMRIDQVMLQNMAGVKRSWCICYSCYLKRSLEFYTGGNCYFVIPGNFEMPGVMIRAVIKNAYNTYMI